MGLAHKCILGKCVTRPGRISTEETNQFVKCVSRMLLEVSVI